MTGLALKMLFGERGKTLGLVLGVAFCTFLVTQQLGLFVGLMLRAQNVIAEVTDADIWVMDPSTEHVDLAQPIRGTSVHRVRGVRGVEWAVPLFKATTPIRTGSGLLRNALVIGVDDATLIGVPRRFVLGDADALRQPDAIAIDRAGYRHLWPTAPLELGRTLELNNRRSVVAAITDARPAFGMQIIVHARFNQAREILGTGQYHHALILAKSEPGDDPRVVARAITSQTGLKALTSDQFAGATVSYYLRKTGIPMNFAVTVGLGVAVGMAIVGLTFRAFIADNLGQFAALKVIGVDSLGVLRLVALQVSVLSILGFAFGTAASACFFALLGGPSSPLRGMHLPWWVVAAAAAMVAIVVSLSTCFSIRRVMIADPAIALRN